MGQGAAPRPSTVVPCQRVKGGPFLVLAILMLSWAILATPAQSQAVDNPTSSAQMVRFKREMQRQAKLTEELQKQLSDLQQQNETRLNELMRENEKLRVANEFFLVAPPTTSGGPAKEPIPPPSVPKP